MQDIGVYLATLNLPLSKFADGAADHVWAVLCFVGGILHRPWLSVQFVSWSVFALCFVAYEGYALINLKSPRTK